MKSRLKPKQLLKYVCLMILLLGLVLGLPELIFLVDIGGLEFATVFLLVYFASIRDALIFRLRALKSEMSESLYFISRLYMFEPSVFLSHTAASGVFVALTCSVASVCLLWLPVVYVSSGYFT